MVVPPSSRELDAEVKYLLGIVMFWCLYAPMLWLANFIGYTGDAHGCNPGVRNRLKWMWNELQMYYYDFIEYWGDHLNE